MRIKPDDVIELANLYGKRNPFGVGKLSARQLFGSALDIFGKPNRRFYEFAGIAAKN